MACLGTSRAIQRKVTKVEFKEHGKNSAMYEAASSNEKLETILSSLKDL